MAEIPRVAQRTGIVIHLSPNGHQLAWNKPPLLAPILTVELYQKWYGLCVLYPDGVVEEISFPERGVGDNVKGLGFEDESDVGDHVCNPKTFIWYANKKGYLIDELAFELIAGRWASEHRDEFKNQWSWNESEVV